MCGWSPPEAWTPDHQFRRGLCVHHCKTYATGGDSGADNLMLLCPNHHAIAHILLYDRRASVERVLEGPASREELIQACLDVEAQAQKPAHERIRPILRVLEQECHRATA